MKLYLAGRYGRRVALRRAATALTTQGYTVQARWLHSRHKPDQLHVAAQEDYEDVVACDALLVWTDPHGKLQLGGGRHFELGVAVHAHKPVIAIGEREMIFHWLPQINWVATLQQAIEMLEPARCHEADDYKWHHAMDILRRGEGCVGNG